MERGLIKKNDIFAYYKPTPAIDSADVQGHLILGHQYIMKNGGFSGLKEKAEHLLNQNENKEKLNFYKASIICCNAAIDWIKRYLIHLQFSWLLLHMVDKMKVYTEQHHQLYNLLLFA